MAIRRFISLEKRLDANLQVKTAYTEFLKEYEDSGHMQSVSWPESNTCHYFMPHHCVLRPEKSTTKCRVVFDASAKCANNISLNDILKVGPVVQNDLIDILLRFRLNKYGLMADITAMYRQIQVYPNDQYMQHIIWQNNTNEELKVYRLKTVTYGTASAPYLATRCLAQLSDDNNQINSTASNIIKHDFYVDDLITGGETLEDINNIKQQISSILKQGQFQLRKWYSNHKEFLQSIPEDEREKTIMVNNNDVVKALGTIWNACTDDLMFFYSADQHKNNKVTKRTVLSELAKLFDPLGLIKPVVVKAKIFLQELWLKRLGWDEAIPDECAEAWKKYVNQLVQLNDIKIARYVLLPNATIELHGFADASTRAYGCCFYLRCCDSAGNIKVSLYTAKSKVAPISTMRTIPCLELCAAHLLVQLLEKVRNLANFTNIVLWSDSVIVLSWLGEHASNFNTFVANRVSYIQEHTTGISWRYVPSLSNPADMTSRGATVEELTQSIWFTGPKFLQQSSEDWPAHPKRHTIDNLPEKRIQKTVLTVSQQSFLDNIYTTNNFNKICRVFAYVRRFIKNCHVKSHRVTFRSLQLAASELDEAFINIVYVIQQKYYAIDINHLKSKQQVNSSSSLRSLNN